MNGFTRFFVGVSGGLAASVSKVLAIDVEKLARFLEHGDLSEISDLRVTIYIFTPILMFLGGLIAWATDESNKMKLLAMGCAAPALIAPWTTGALDIMHPTPTGSAYFSIVSTSYAQEASAKPSKGGLLRGVRVLFGLESVKDQRYWVIVGSYKDVDGAQAFADAVNAADPGMQAFVGQRQPENEYYPVIVGGTAGYLPYDQAQSLRSRATGLDIVPESAYLSAFADRLPPAEGG